MTQLKGAKSGDVGDVRIITLQETVNLTSVAANLTNAASVRAIVRCKHESAVLAATIADAANGIIEVNLGVAPTDWLPAGPTPGDWLIEYEVTFNDGSILTWPNEAHDKIKVTADLS